MPVFSLKALLNELDVPGPFLLRRDYGQRCFPMLEDELRQIPLGRALTLDFEGVAVMDTSFGDETVVELAAGLADDRYGDRFLLLQGPSPATVDNLEGALARRREKIALVAYQTNQVRIIGHLEPNLDEAWTLTCREREVTARRLADLLGLQINTASMRLHKLYRARLLARREEISPTGRQHVYAMPA
jgi:hypothetical protein